MAWLFRPRLSRSPRRRAKRAGRGRSASGSGDDLCGVYLVEMTLRGHASGEWTGLIHGDGHVEPGQGPPGPRGSILQDREGRLPMGSRIGRAPAAARVLQHVSTGSADSQRYRRGGWFCRRPRRVMGSEVQGGRGRSVQAVAAPGRLGRDLTMGATPEAAPPSGRASRGRHRGPRSRRS